MMRAVYAAIIAAGLSTPASADAASRNISGTTVKMQATTEPGAVAEIIFDNQPENGPGDNGTFTLTLGGLDVEVTFIWGVGDDAITVIPPDGYFADPERLDVPEGGLGVLHIYSYEAVGM